MKICKIEYLWNLQLYIGPVIEKYTEQTSMRSFFVQIWYNSGLVLRRYRGQEY